MEKKSGGPAFPIMGGSCDFEFTGLTLRGFFAAHAPVVPDWFKHNPSSNPPRVVAGNDQMMEHVISKIQYNDWANKQKAEKFFEWRKFYADCMVAEFSV